MGDAAAGLSDGRVPLDCRAIVDSSLGTARRLLMKRAIAPTTLAIPFGTTASADFVIDDAGTELRAIVTNEGAVESRVYRKQFPRGRRE
jgi:hypothetical protein